MKKVAFVTGASGDIGRACAIQLANDGYSVAVGFNSDEASANELSAQLKGCGHEAITVACDVCSDPGITAAVSLICKELGSIDVLVNNAGIADIRLFTDNSFEDIQRMINTDLIGAMELSRQVLPDMIRKKSGCIINISSVWGEKGASCEVAYSAAKAGLIGFTKALAREAAPSGIRVNCISCGFIDTKMNGELSQSDRQAVIDEIAACRAGTPQDIANTVSFLADARSDYINGQVIRVDGCWI